MIKYFPLFRFLRLGLAFTFLANGLSAFLAPAEFTQLISSSFLYKDLIHAAPFFIYFIGLNDLCLAVLLVIKFFPVEIAWWAVFSMLGVISVFMTQGNSLGYLSALELGAPLGVALYLALSPSAKTD